MPDGHQIILRVLRLRLPGRVMYKYIWVKLDICKREISKFKAIVQYPGKLSKILATIFLLLPTVVKLLAKSKLKKLNQS